MKRITITNVSKDFKIGFIKNQTFLSRLASILSGKVPKKTFHALKDVSFEINQGEIVGLIGKNGSGKTTLLRIISGIFQKYEGHIDVNGRVTTLIDLARGFNPRLTLTDNIFVSGSLLGMSQKEIQQKLPSIIEFAELENFRNTKLYQFSSGMGVRLAVSIALHTNPDILLADEIFSMGDVNFIIKVEKRIREITEKGTSVILVSHRLDIVEKYCDRVIWLEKGIINKQGNTREIIKEYKEKNELIPKNN